MSLTDAKPRTLKPSDNPFKVRDSHGLYLLVKPGGSRHWYLKYPINGKETHIALSAYPAFSLSEVRQQYPQDAGAEHHPCATAGC